MADFPVLPRTPPGLCQKERVECAMGFMADWEAAFHEPAPKRRASLDFPNGSAASATTPPTPSFPYSSADNPSNQRGFAGGSGRSRGRRSSLDVPRSMYGCDSQGRPAEAGRDESAAAAAAAAAACTAALERNSIQGPLPEISASPSQVGGRRVPRGRTGKGFQESGSPADQPQSSSQAARGRSAASAGVADGGAGAPGAARGSIPRIMNHRHADGFVKGIHPERVEVCGGQDVTRLPQPDGTWPAGEGKLQEWVDWTVVDLSLRPQGLMQARAAMIANGCGGVRKVSPTS